MALSSGFVYMSVAPCPPHAHFIWMIWTTPATRSVIAGVAPHLQGRVVMP
ncbi:hypothetical protein BN2497_1929 [Janthinobacterium sp. CG23_2]|nr:hypothetical protein BN2497_1929 [Janthinobacterium sp. CG23_2]CUU27362.1 hypothetical protein BN3177_1929 [Janthinobacterium sp. CG23_2]